MNESDYERLATSCDRLLAAARSDRPRLAIGMLHVIHEHPSWLAQYRRVFDPAAAPIRERPPVRQARDAYRMLRGVRRAMASGDRRAPLHGGPLDVLIVSRLTHDSQLAGTDDFYFGAMPGLLRERGASVQVALIDHRAGPASAAVDCGAGRMLLPASVPLRDEIAIWRQCAHTRATLFEEARAARDPLDRRVAQLSAEQALAATTVENLRLYARIRTLCESLRPRNVLTTFEGDASERMIFLAARDSGAGSLCVGYQHTRLLPHSHAVRRMLGTPALPCDPDAVLTLGAETQSMLERADRRDTRYIVYGSHRRWPDGSAARASRAPSCLVIPDAEPSEHRMLFDFSRSCARKLPGIRFVFRPHPAVNAELRAPAGGMSGSLPANLRVDGVEPLATQAASARCCLYRASSAVFHAVMAGARPLHLLGAHEIPFDPLTAMPEGRSSVRSVEDLARLAQETDWEGSDAARAAGNYCDRYISPVRPAALDELLALRGARPGQR